MLCVMVMDTACHSNTPPCEVLTCHGRQHKHGTAMAGGDMDSRWRRDRDGGGAHLGPGRRRLRSPRVRQLQRRAGDRPWRSRSDRGHRAAAAAARWPSPRWPGCGRSRSVGRLRAVRVRCGGSQGQVSVVPAKVRWPVTTESDQKPQEATDCRPCAADAGGRFGVITGHWVTARNE